MAEKLEIQIVAKDRASGPLKKVSSALGEMSKKAGGVLFSKGITAGFSAIASGAQTLAKGLGHVVTSGSDANEMLSKFGIVFGPQAVRVTSEIDQMSDAMGRNRFELMKQASSFQDLLVPMGFGRKEAADFSLEMVKMTQDLASFNNMAEADVFAALTSGLVGESEPLRQFGVMINENAIKAEALALGLVKAETNAGKLTKKQNALENAQISYNNALSKYGAGSDQARRAANSLENAQINLSDAMEGTVGQLDAQAKAQAIMSLIAKGTTDAQDDATRTAGSWANQVKRLWGTFDEFAATLGSKVVPTLEPVLIKINDFISLLTSPVVLESLTQLATGISTWITSLFPNIAGLKSGILAFLTALQSGIPITGAFASFLYAAFGPEARDKIMPTIQSIIDFVSGLVGAFRSAAAGDGPLQQFVNGIIGAFEFLKPMVLQFATDMLNSFMSWLAGPGGVSEQTPSALTSLLNTISTWIETSWPAIMTRLQTWSANFWGWMLGSGGVVEQTDSVFTQLVDGLSAWITQNQAEIERLGENIGSIVFDILGTVFSNSQKIGEVLVALTESLVTNTPVIVDGLVRFGEGIASGVIDALAKKLELDLGPRVKTAIVTALRGTGRAALSAIPGLNIAGGIGQLLNFDQGGIVPGRTGQPTLAMVHGGERVLTPQQQRTMNDNRTFNLNFNSPVATDPVQSFQMIQALNAR